MSHSDNGICGATATAKSSAIYHERQIRELCALHTLNNLFQERGSFSKAQLDHICTSLSPDEWINPHRSVFGLGNYDVNVLQCAVQQKGFETVWFDKRKHPSCIDTAFVYGFILNVPSEYKLGFVALPLRRRHWLAVRRINGEYWNLDSKLNGPQNIGSERALIEFLAKELNAGGKEKELFLVVDSDTERAQKWLRSPANGDAAECPATEVRAPEDDEAA